MTYLSVECGAAAELCNSARGTDVRSIKAPGVVPCRVARSFILPAVVIATLHGCTDHDSNEVQGSSIDRRGGTAVIVGT